MVMAEQHGMTKIAAWDELVLGDLVIHCGNLELRARYANVCRSHTGGIQRPDDYAGVQIIHGPTPHIPTHYPQVHIAAGEPIVIVRFMIARQGWTRPRPIAASALGIVPPARRNPALCTRVCLPYTRLGMINYDSA
jgi:hypothetical protein